MASNGHRHARPIRSKSCVVTGLMTANKTGTGDETQLSGCRGTHGGRQSKRRRSRTGLDNDDVARSNCRKWRPLPLSQTGFVISLLPRRQTAYSDFDEVTYRYADVWSGAAAPNDEENIPSSPMALIVPATYRSADAEIADDSYCSQMITDDVEAMWLQCQQESINDDTSDYDMDNDGELTDDEHQTGLLRTKKKWRVEKARRQLKTRHCRTVKNCVHGVSLYINHRVLKRMTLTVQPTSHRPCCVTLRRIDKEKSLLAIQNVKRQPGRLQSHHIKQMPAFYFDDDASIFSDLDSLSMVLFAADTCNADRTLPADAMSLLVELQHRELSPNDYELLLRLDDRVQPRTVSELQLSALPVNELSVTDVDQHSPITCAVCLELLTAGQRCKALPCGHSFHDVCIDAWLRQSSTKCPLDGLELYS